MIVIVCVFLFVSNAHAQDKSHDLQAETSASVPALTKFHSVIYPLWHKGWPEKDYELLKSLVPKIQKHVEEISAVTLTGILRDKQQLWLAQVASLNAVVKEYTNAAEANENQRLLDAVEKLHMQYEKLVRIIRPVLKELSEFHTILYGLYHYALPEYDLPAIRAAVLDLQKAMPALDNASLPVRMKSKSEAFAIQREKLSTSVDSLATIVRTDDREKISAAVETVHTYYRDLEKVFDE